MEMTEVFNRLKTLQDILVEKYDLEKKIESSPKQLDSQRELLERLQKEYVEKNKNYEELKTKVDELRVQLSAAEASREAGEKNMDSITSHREYEALDKQITEASEREAAIRKDLLREEKELAGINESLKADEELINAQKTGLAEGENELQKQIKSYSDTIQNLKNQEEDVTKDLNQEIVYKFQKIIQRNSEGIVAVKNGVCTGCNMILPGQFANEVHDGEKILFCPYCSRILFYQEVAEDEIEDYTTLEETGSLADFDDEFADEREDDDEENGLGDGDGDNGLDDEKSMSFDD